MEPNILKGECGRGGNPQVAEKVVWFVLAMLTERDRRKDKIGTEGGKEARREGAKEVTADKVGKTDSQWRRESVVAEAVEVVGGRWLQSAQARSTPVIDLRTTLALLTYSPGQGRRLRHQKSYNTE